MQGVLKDFGYDLLSAPVNEFELSYGLSLNVLAVSERNVIAIEDLMRLVPSWALDVLSQLSLVMSYAFHAVARPA